MANKIAQRIPRVAVSEKCVFAGELKFTQLQTKEGKTLLLNFAKQCHGNTRNINESTSQVVWCFFTSSFLFSVFRKTLSYLSVLIRHGNISSAQMAVTRTAESDVTGCVNLQHLVNRPVDKSKVRMTVKWYASSPSLLQHTLHSQN